MAVQGATDYADSDIPPGRPRWDAKAIIGIPVMTIFQQCRAQPTITALVLKRACLQEPADEAEFESLLEEISGTGVKTEVIIRLLGIQNCVDTVVGNAYLRGVSGGERKRVTSAEMLVGPKVRHSACPSVCLCVLATSKGG